MDVVASIHTALPTDGTAPEWVHLVPAGTFNGLDGRGPYTLADPEAVIRVSMSRDALVLDENHATDHAHRDGKPAPARGWIAEMQHRPDGLWGRVDWNEAGRQLMADRSYRYLSPVFLHGKTTGVITRVLRAALTNAPNLQLTALHTQEAPMDFATQLRQALGLAATADEPAIVAAATAAHTAVAAHTQQLATIATTLGAPQAATAEAIVTAIQARGSANALDQVVALQAQLTELQTAAKRGKAETAIDAAIAAGKPIPPAAREDCIARHVADPAGTQAWLDMMPSLHTGGLGVRPAVPPAASGGVGAGEASIIAVMGLSAAEFAKTRDQMIERGVIAR